MKNFSDLGLAEPILRAVAAEGYVTPTPIQAQVIPVMMSGQDILGIAQTGTGKTASFVLPLLNQIATHGKRPTPKACDALILAPTRELVAQIADNIRAYSQFMRTSVTVIVGGVKPGPQIRRLGGGSHIIVATPGRLLDHLTNGAVTLEQTKAVVLDEADHMLDLGFIPDIRRIMKQLPKKRQTALLSATMPQQIRALAKDFQNNPAEIAVAVESRPIERINQSVRHTARTAKRDILTDILSKTEVERAIVFTRTKRGADRVSQHLQKAGLQATAIHGNKSQGQRVRALESFRNGETTIMVATDIAARGIDIDDVSHVINFELPEVAEAYVHRIGRTARAGRDGVAISLCDPSESKLLRDIEKLIGSKLEAENDEGYSPLNVEVPDVATKADPAAGAQRRKARNGRGKPRKNGAENGSGRSNGAGAKSPNGHQKKANGTTRNGAAHNGSGHSGAGPNGTRDGGGNGNGNGRGGKSRRRFSGKPSIASTSPVKSRGNRRGGNQGAASHA